MFVRGKGWVFVRGRVGVRKGEEVGEGGCS